MRKEAQKNRLICNMIMDSECFSIEWMHLKSINKKVTKMRYLDGFTQIAA